MRTLFHTHTYPQLSLGQRHLLVSDSHNLLWSPLVERAPRRLSCGSMGIGAGGLTHRAGAFYWTNNWQGWVARLDEARLDQLARR